MLCSCHLNMPCLAASALAILSIPEPAPTAVSSIPHHGTRTRAIHRATTRCAQELGKLFGVIRQQINILFRLSESVALLDMLLSFCTFVNQSGGDYCQPRIGQRQPLVLRRSRHPLLESLSDSSVRLRPIRTCCLP